MPELLSRKCLFFALILMATLFSAGCGRTVTVTGKLTYKSQPLTGDSEKYKVSVFFKPMLEGDQEAEDKPLIPARVEQGTGTFSVELPAGRYRIVVKQIDVGMDRDNLNDRFKEGTSPIIRDLNENSTLELNLDNPAG